MKKAKKAVPRKRKRVKHAAACGGMPPPKKRKRAGATKRKRTSTGATTRRRKPLQMLLEIPDVRLDSAALGELTAAQRLELAGLSAKKASAARPSWASDENMWRKATRVVATHWNRLGQPWAAVAFAYQRMGGTIGRAAHGGGASGGGGGIRIGSIVNVARSRYADDGVEGVHTVVGRTSDGKDLKLVRGEHPDATEDEYELFVTASRVSPLRAGGNTNRERAPKHRRQQPGGGGRSEQRVQVEPVELDELGYDEGGTYYGVGSPLWRVFNASIDSIVRAASAAAARAIVLNGR